MELRQSLKGVKVAYALILAFAAAIVAYWLTQDKPPADIPVWAPLIAPAALLLMTVIRHIQRRTTSLTVTGDRIRYEAGLFSKTTRIIELAKVQDVRVDQKLGQRMFDVGDLSLETAGGSSRIVVPSIDRPKQAADHILELSRALRGKTSP